MRMYFSSEIGVRLEFPREADGGRRVAVGPRPRPRPQYGGQLDDQELSTTH